jgi:hypothetical protein
MQHLLESLVADEPQTVRERVYEIRKALGPDRRTPLSQGEFAKRANAVAARHGLKSTYDASFISKIESGIRAVSIEEVPVFAALDPLKRGEMWLAWGINIAAPILDLDPSQDHRLTDEELERAEKKVAEKAQPSRRPRVRKTAGKKGRGRA